MEWLAVHQAAKTYGVRPSQLLGISPTDPAALVVDIAMSHRATAWELEHGAGEYWWVSVLKALTGGGSNDGATATKQPTPQNVRWF